MKNSVVKAVDHDSSEAELDTLTAELQAEVEQKEEINEYSGEYSGLPSYSDLF